MTRSTKSIEDAVDRFYDEDGAAVELVPLRHGHWMNGSAQNTINSEVRPIRTCSICGAGYFRYDYTNDTIGDVPNYCPECGAKMDEEAEDERMGQR